MSHVKKIFFLSGLLFLIGKGFSQTASSPYSTFGVGERYGNGLAYNQGMGGTGVAQPQYFYTNNVNPALLVYNTLTIFNAGILYEQRNINSAAKREKTSGGNLNYIITSFPIKYGVWSTSIGVSPYSTVKYNFAGSSTVATDTFETYDNGSGGLTQVTWGNGFKIFKTSNSFFSFGVKVNYVFGSIYNLYQNRSVSTIQPVNYYATIEDRSYTKDFTFQAGVSYVLDSLFARKKYRLAIGALYDASGNLRTRTRTLLYRTDVVGNKGTQIDLDTISGKMNKVTLPAGITTGITLTKQKWSIATEFSYYDWSVFRGAVTKANDGLGQNWRASIGGEVTPDSYSSSFLKRMTYRAGAYFEQLPYPTKVKDLGMTVGISLPAGSSSMDIGFRYGRRGTVPDNQIAENYFRVYFGVTVNDRWFIKRKFD